MSPPERLPARTIADIALADDAFRADFEITDKYQAFSTELLRLSLLGIAGYGFLLSQLRPSGEAGKAFFDAVRGAMPWLSAGLVALGLSAGLALAHRFFSTDCLGHQVTILRLLRRQHSPEWQGAEQATVAERLEKERDWQGEDLRRCRHLLVGSAICLFLGAAAVAGTFVSVILRL